MTTNTRIDLKVPYAEKDQAKVHGAEWDTENRTWYAPPGTDLQNLKRWLPKGVLTENPIKRPLRRKLKRASACRNCLVKSRTSSTKHSHPPYGFVPRFPNYVARTDTYI